MVVNWLTWRTFKECRNSIIHRGGKTDQRTVDAYNDIVGITAADIDVAEVPEMFTMSAVDETVKISLRGVVGFSQIVLKLVEVIDTELIKSEKAIDCFVKQVKEYTPYAYTLSQDTRISEKKIIGIMRRSGFLQPKHSAAFLHLLRNTGIIRL